MAVDIDAFAALSGDVNDLHLNHGYARQFGFRGRVAHGMLTGAILSKVLGTEFPGRGIGAAIACAFARRGVKVVIGYRSNEVAAEKVVREIEEAGGTARRVAANITTEDGVRILAATSLEAFGAVHVLVNNATPHIHATPLMELSWESMQTYIDAYLRGPMLLAKALVPGMAAVRYGRIINILSSYMYGVPLTAWVVM